MNETKSPGTGATDTYATSSYTWISPEQIVSSNNLDSESTMTSGDIIIRDREVRLRLGDDDYSSDNKASDTNWNNLIGGDETYIYGGESDLWGETLTPSDVNSSDFGLGLVAQDFTNQTESGPTMWTEYLIGYNFGFSIPETAEITGVEAQIEHEDEYVARANVTIAHVDHFQLTVYYNDIYPQVRMYSWLVPLLGVFGFGVSNGILFRKCKQRRVGKQLSYA